jgi:hypothetical protein
MWLALARKLASRAPPSGANQKGTLWCASAYQLAFLTPGDKPFEAKDRIIVRAILKKL